MRPLAKAGIYCIASGCSSKWRFNIPSSYIIPLPDSSRSVKAAVGIVSSATVLVALLSILIPCTVFWRPNQPCAGLIIWGTILEPTFPPVGPSFVAKATLPPVKEGFKNCPAFINAGTLVLCIAPPTALPAPAVSSVGIAQ